MNPWRDRLPPRERLPRIHRDSWLLQWRGWSIVLTLALSICLLGVCASALNKIVDMANDRRYTRWAYERQHGDNVTVQFRTIPGRGPESPMYNLGEHGLNLVNQMTLLETIKERHGWLLQDWWLASTHTPNGTRNVERVPLRRLSLEPFDENQFVQNHPGADFMDVAAAGLQHENMVVMDHTVTDILDLLEISTSPSDDDQTLTSEIFYSDEAYTEDQDWSHLQGRQHHTRMASQPPLPGEVGGGPMHMPDEPKLASSKVPNERPLSLVRKTIGDPNNARFPTIDLVASPAPSNTVDLGPKESGPPRVILPPRGYMVLRNVTVRLLVNEALPDITRKVLTIMERFIDTPVRPPPPTTTSSLPVPTTTTSLPEPTDPPQPTDPPTRPTLGKGPRAGKEASRAVAAAHRAAENQKPADLGGDASADRKLKRALTTKQRKEMRGAALPLIDEEVKKAIDEDPDYPQNHRITVQAVTMVFNQLGDFVEDFVARHPDEDPNPPDGKDEGDLDLDWS